MKEASWLKALSNLPLWDIRGLSTIVVAPHPDDETLCAGGVIAALRARGKDVSVAAVTDGEAAYTDYPSLGSLRSHEQEWALNRLGVASEHIFRLHLPDGKVSSHEQALIEAIVPLVSSSALILAPWPGDFHPDHEACGRAAVEVSRLTGAALSFYLFWTWHRGTVELIEHLPLRLFPLDHSLLSAKKEALQFHRSQLEHDSGHPILPVNLLAPVQRPFEVFIDA